MRAIRALSGIALFGVAVSAAAQQFPTHTIRLVSGVTPGSASDTMARILAERMQKDLGQSVIVENKLGAGGLIGAKYVANSEPDGHTIMMYTSAFTVSTLISPGLDPKDLRPVATVATIPTILITPVGRYKTAADFVAAAKASPGKLACATAGVGSSTHMALERFRIAAGFQVLNVHTKGANDALEEVIAGRADCYFALVFQAQKQRDAGKVTALAASAPKRSSLMPDVPTTVELGYPDSDYNFWIGTLVPAKTPDAVVKQLHDEIDKLVQSPDIAQRIRALGADPLSMSIQDFDAMIQRELVANAQLVKTANMKGGE